MRLDNLDANMTTGVTVRLRLRDVEQEVLCPDAVQQFFAGYFRSFGHPVNMARLHGVCIGQTGLRQHSPSSVLVRKSPLTWRSITP